MCNSFIHFAWRLYVKITLLINCINGSNYNPTLYKPEAYNMFTMEMAFTFWEEGCDWSISSMKWCTASHHTKAGSQLLRVKNRIPISHQTFCAGNVHTDTCQCVVLSKRTSLAMTIFATDANKQKTAYFWIIAEVCKLCIGQH